MFLTMLGTLGSWATLLGGNEPAHLGVNGRMGQRGRLGLFWKMCARLFPSLLFFILINIIITFFSRMREMRLEEFIHLAQLG